MPEPSASTPPPAEPVSAETAPRPPASPGEPGAAPPEAAGLVLGSMDATPLEFWIGVADGRQVQLDDLVTVETQTPTGQTVRFYGIVDIVRKRYEGAQFDSDAFRAAAGALPVEISYAAHVQTTRIDPEVFVPPQPGDPARVVRGEDFQRALYFDRMERRVVIGTTRTGEPLFANLEFLDGTRGAHASVSGVSGVATKTSYATFLLYSLFHSGALGADAVNAKALIFNVKGEDLLWLDRPNARLDADARAEYARLGLPVGPFASVGLFAPARRRSAVPIPDTSGRQEGVRPYLWTVREFARDRLLRFAFAEAEDARAQLSFVILRVERALEQAEHVRWLNEWRPPTAAELKCNAPRLHEEGRGFYLCPECGRILDAPEPEEEPAKKGKGRKKPKKAGDKDAFNHAPSCTRGGARGRAPLRSRRSRAPSPCASSWTSPRTGPTRTTSCGAIRSVTPCGPACGTSTCWTAPR